MSEPQPEHFGARGVQTLGQDGARVVWAQTGLQEASATASRRPILEAQLTYLLVRSTCQCIHRGRHKARQMDDPAEDEEPAPDDESDVQERTPRQQPSHLLPPMATTRSRPRHVRRSLASCSRATRAWPALPASSRAASRCYASSRRSPPRRGPASTSSRVRRGLAGLGNQHPLMAAHALSAAPARRRRRVREAGQVRRRAAGLLRLRARRVRGRRRRVRAGRAAAGRAGAPLVAARVRDALGVVGAAAAAHLQLLPGAAGRAARASVRSELTRRR